jgi:predicted flap endonuclease-1-like 5' DNA nuclease
MTRKPTASSTAQPRSHNFAIEQLPGLSEDHLDRLRLAGITTTFHLLRQAWTPLGKEDLASRLQLHAQYVQKWVALADLARVPGVGCQYCGLLLHAGVSTVEHLAASSVGQLHRQVLKLQVATLQRPDRCPTLGEVEGWIQQAKTLLRSEKSL